MFSWSIYSYSLATIGLFAFAGWLLSLLRKNVTHVDSMWSLFFVIAAFTTAAFVLFVYPAPARLMLVLVCVTIWALRLFIYLTWRNWGPHEDSRYLQIRNNNQPHFWLKSIYIIFGLQALLAWVISISLHAAISATSPLNLLDYAGLALFVFGLVWETLADVQLSNFKAKPNNAGKVLNTGLWRYSRHPNYFGECCVWWAFYSFALAGGAWWAIISPILMTLLLLKISGVSLLESTIVDRRPAYAEYIRTTNAFFPGGLKQ
jgi:steroid 5-alpha reductase family enzyme